MTKHAALNLLQIFCEHSMKLKAQTKSNQHLIWYACHCRSANHKSQDWVNPPPKRVLLFIQLLVVRTPRNAFFHHSGMQYLCCQAFQMLKCHSLSRASRALLTHSNAYKQPLTAELRVSHSPSVKKGSVQCQRWACCRKRYPQGSPLSISLCNLFHLPRREERQREREK